jgi:myo-inositol-1(or 4)-monophosphatase
MMRFDIKLELDLQCQKLIEETVLGAFPEHAFFGEEGIAGATDSPYQWVVDPLDGTVNYFYGIPHFCVSVALRREGETILGVIYDPMQDELFEAERGRGAFLNGRPIESSTRDRLGDCVVMMGFAKTADSIGAGVERFAKLAYQVRKTRMLGSAALALAYVACGRLDAYIEELISLWDIAAGHLIVEEAGGTVELRPSPVSEEEEKFAIVASNGRVTFDL